MSALLPREVVCLDEEDGIPGEHVLRVIGRLWGYVDVEHVLPTGTRCCTKRMDLPAWRRAALWSTTTRVVWFDPAPVQVSA